MAYAKLSIDLVANVAKFSGDMGKLAQASEKSAQRMSAAFGVAKASLAGLGAGISLGAITSLAKASIDSVDALNDLKDATGASIENLSALEDVAARTGTSFDNVGTALVKFNAVLKDAKPGSDAANIIDGLGLSLEALRTLDPAEALRLTSVALQGISDEGTRARVVQELFSKSVRDVAPFLKDLAEQGKLVATVTTAQADEAERFNKQLFALQKNAQDLTRSLSIDLVTGINKAADAFKQSGLIEGFRTLFTGDDQYKNNKNLVELTDQLLRAENELSKARAADAQYGDKSQRTAAAEKQLASVKQQLATVQAYQKVLQEVDKPATASKRVALPTRDPTKPAKGPDPDADFKRYIDNLKKQIEATRELNTVQQLNADIAAGRLTVSPAEKKVAEDLAREVDLIAQVKAEEQDYAAVLKLNRAAQNDIDAARIKAAEDEIRAKQDRLQGLLGNTVSARFEAQQADVRLLADEFEAGRISEQQYVEAIQARLDLTSEKLIENKDLAKELGLSFTSAFEDAIVEGKSFGDVLQGLEKDILRIATRKLVTEPLGNAVSSAAGDLFSNLFGGFRASGGPVSASTPYVVGELGPELFVPSGNGAVIPNNALGGVSIVQNINIDSRSDQATIMAAMNQAKEMAKAEILRSRQRGGVFA